MQALNVGTVTILIGFLSVLVGEFKVQSSDLSSIKILIIILFISYISFYFFCRGLGATTVVSGLHYVGLLLS